MSAYLQTVRLTELGFASKPIITIPSTDSVGDALKKLSDANIYCAPIHDAATSSTLGLLDLADLTSHLVGLFAARAKIPLGKKQETFDAFSSQVFSAQDLNELLSEFLGSKAADVMNRSGQNAFQPKPLAGATVADMISTLSKRELSRVPLVDPNGQVVLLLSQSTIINFLAKHLDEVAEIVNQSIDKANIGTRTLLTVKESARALDAFVLLHEHQISAVGYLGENNRVAGNISVKDIKGILLDKAALLGPVTDYVNIIRQSTIKDTIPLINVHTTDIVGKAIGKLAAVGIHRLYLFNESGSPIGIVALSDILRLFR